MTKYLFRKHTPNRTCTKKYADYHSYRPALENDFLCRCAYCNLDKAAITTPFEIDHFIPRAVFKDARPELETDYENLVYSCKKCNRAKSDKYEGGIGKSIIENELFYDPVKCDYNAIFYRTDLGEIWSDDEKGRNMITLLRLYRPIHAVAWVNDQLKDAMSKLEAQMEHLNPASEKYKKLQEAFVELKCYYADYRDAFIANYNNE